MKYITRFFLSFTKRIRTSDEEIYLSKSVDHADLESRIKKLRYSGFYL